MFQILLAAALMAAPTDNLIPYEKFVLDNGLTVVVHEDRKAPVVAVNVWYHVGSKNEQPGKTGFAHLFEHLMFQGSEHYADEFFKPLQEAGATGVNGTTSFDRTNYFQVVPKNAVDLALFLESDRMGHLLGAIDQERLDEQRGVVQNEKRQGENQPYGRVFTQAFEKIFPAGHPYSWPVIGSMEDLEAASLEDVEQWFQTYYGPSNATLILAGDIDVETARAKAEKYFGAIPPGPPLTRPERWIPRIDGERRDVMYDRVPQHRVYQFFLMPELGNPEAILLDLAAATLSEGKNSRLYKRLVIEDQTATGVAAWASPLEIAGLFAVIATVQPGEDPARVEAAIADEVERFLADGPTAEEIDRITTSRRASFLRGLERVGGFGGKSSVLAEGEVYHNDPGYYRKSLQRLQAATPQMVHTAAKDWLRRGSYTIEVRPFPSYVASDEMVDREAGLPETGDAPLAPFPAFERKTLDNGLELIVAQRADVPVVQLIMMMDAGIAADSLTRKGVADLTMSMLDEGTSNRNKFDISRELQRLGASLGAGSSLDISSISLGSLSENLAASFEIFADVILNPTFPEDDLDRLRKLQLAQIAQEKAQPLGIAYRVFPPLLFGEDHAYSVPFSGSGTERSVAAITRGDLLAFHREWFKPNHATLIAAGDISMQQLEALATKAFGSWQPGEVPEKNIASVQSPTESVVYLVDRPDSVQSIIFAGHLFPSKKDDREAAIEALTEILGGSSITGRVGMNLREQKGWAYGAYTFSYDTQGPRPFIAYAPVQADKTAAAMRELFRELTGIQDEQPPREDELLRVKNEYTRSLAGRWETNAAVASSIAEIVRFGFADDYWIRYPEEVRRLDLDSIAEAAVNVLKPEQLVWVVVGDRSQVEAEIRDLGFGELRLIDVDGNVVEARTATGN